MALKVACLLADGFEDSEFREPVNALEEAGFEVDVVADKKGKRLHGKQGKEAVKANRGIDDLPQVSSYDALFIPGGYSPDHLRANPAFVRFVQAFAQLDRPVFAICHGPQLLMTAGLVDERRTLTGWPTVQRDLAYTGATVLDQPVVVDGKWVTSRAPEDLQEFCQTVVQLLRGEYVAPAPEQDASSATVH